MTDASDRDETTDAASAAGGQPAEFVDTPGNEPGAQATDPEPPDAEELEKGKRRSGRPPVADG